MTITPLSIRSVRPCHFCIFIDCESGCPPYDEDKINHHGSRLHTLAGNFGEPCKYNISLKEFTEAIDLELIP
jgi:hypothetical protein